MRTITVTSWEPTALKSALSETTCETILTTKCPTQTIPIVTANSVTKHVGKLASTTIQGFRASSTATSSHATATNLVDTLLKRIPLPDALSSWKPLLDYFKSPTVVYGIAGVGAMYIVSRYLKGCYSRRKVKMVLSFINYKVHNNSQLWNLLSEPDQLLAILDKDIQAFAATWLSEEEGKIVRDTIKRSLWIEEEVEEQEDARPSKRRRDDEEEGEEPEDEEDEDEEEEEEEEEDPDVEMEDAPSLSPSPKLESEASDESHTESQSQNAATEVQKPVFGAYYPTIKTTQEPTDLQPDDRASLERGQTPQSDGSYGFDYDDFESSSESSDDSSPLAPKKRQQQQQSTHRPKAVKPQKPFRATPPTALAQASRYRVAGTNLSPVNEGSSDVSSLDETKTQYRVAGTRKFFSATKSAEVARGQRHPAVMLPSSPPAPSSSLPVETTSKYPARTQPPHPKRGRKSLNADTPVRRSSRASAYKGKWQR
ncbi:hypothetical protein DM02DRAFT_611874 [Periconia macrospinosa]|uniref:Uncharacterized protein n=1 Tax=Periconia macrospinosa TaxID=97972 RepID=A0A2V1E1A0_9PLEO|nr:hypothetical protein DM02DRAFT_611874 [Periconia macrospinosa]